MNTTIDRLEIKRGKWYVVGADDTTGSGIGKVFSIEVRMVPVQHKEKRLVRTEVSEVHYEVDGALASVVINHRNVIRTVYKYEQDNSNKNS